MVNIDEINLLYNDIFKWLQKRSFKGFDPYDGANSQYSYLKFSKLVRLALVYFNKFSPVNFRKLFGINEQINLHALSLIIRALINYDVNANININYLLQEKIDYIKSKSLVSQYGYHCWNGNDMYIQTKTEYQTPFIPGVIGTEVCANAIFSYYKKISKDIMLKEILISTRDFFLERLYQEFNGISFIKYKPITHNNIFIYNASILGACYILKINDYFNLTKGNEKAIKCIKDLLKFQKNDGSWNYGINLLNHKEDKQVDFHQGFILDCLSDYISINNNDTLALEAFKKGFNFFRKRQYLDSGMGYYRYPKLYPANIQNQAQGIISSIKCANRSEPDYTEVYRILNWTIENMYNNRKNEFYFLKYRFFSNKIPYIRWNQASMFYALSVLLSSISE